jgi:hypothetical protein
LNNYFRAGSDSRHQEIRIDAMPLDGQVYVAGNFTFDSRDSKSLIESRIKMPENFKLAPDFLFVPSNVTMSSAEAAYKDVLSYAGVIYPVRDGVDLRIIDEVKNGTGDIIDSQNQVGAWPDYHGGLYPPDNDNDGIPNDWEIAHGTDPDFAGDASSPIFQTPTGYTWIEEYINSLIPFPSQQ